MSLSTSLAEQLGAREPAQGVLLPIPSSLLVEHAGRAGLDFVIIDTEHRPADPVTLSTHVATAAAVGLKVLMRVGGPTDVYRSLDLGATGIVTPSVSSVDEAESVVAAAGLATAGLRGFANSTDPGGLGRADAGNQVDHARDDVVIFATIEDPRGVDEARAIAEVEGISGLLLVHAALGDSHREEARTQVRDAAHHAGCSFLSVCSDAATARHLFATGSDAVVYDLQAALSVLFNEFAGVRPDVQTLTGRHNEGLEPLVLLPGMLGDAGTWDAVAARLANDVPTRVGRIDLDDSIEQMAESVLADAPARFALAGHSLGAIVALEVARRAPHRVARLALLNASARDGSADQQRAWTALRQRLDNEPFSSVATDLARANLPDHRRGDADLVARSKAMANSVGPDGLRRQLTAQAKRPDSRPTLHTHTMPVVVVSGEKDQVCPPHLQEELVAGLPVVEHVVLEDVGHMAPMEDPDAVTKILQRWLRRT